MPQTLKAQASMTDVLLLGLLISIMLIGGVVFIGSEEARAQQARRDTIYAQTQLTSLLNYRNDSWNNESAAARIDDMACNKYDEIIETQNCSYKYTDEKFYWELQNFLNLTKRNNYNYIFYVINNVPLDISNQNNGVYNFTICNKQLTVCAQHLPAIARTRHTCTNGITVDYWLGIWPDHLSLPEKCPTS